jgi:hypothetical protein
MELSSHATISELISDTERSARVIRRPRMTLLRADSRADYRAPASKSRLRICRCGECRECAENARWDRIFNEKFADPEYYSREYIRYESPLNQW